MTENNVQRSNDVDKLRYHVGTVKDKIIDVLTEYDDILLQQNPKIEIDYAIKIGCYENELFKNDVARRRAKRKLALAVVQLNHGNAPDIKRIEKTLDGEFEEWSDKLAAKLKHYEYMLELRNGSRAATPHESRELAKLHRKLVKRLHPDIHPNQSPQDLQMFYTVQQAYERGDLEMLNAIYVSIGGDNITEDELDCDLTLEELQIELDVLNVTLDVFTSKLNELKHGFPYCYKDRLQDADWVSERVQGIKTQISECQDAARAYDMRLDETLRGAI
jgi:hypothetical protein